MFSRMSSNHTLAGQEVNERKSVDSVHFFDWQWQAGKGVGIPAIVDPTVDFPNALMNFMRMFPQNQNLRTKLLEV